MEGVVKHVGITDLQPENLKWVIEHVPAGTVESVLCFCHYSLNDEMLLDYLDFFEAKQCGHNKCFAVLDGTVVAARCTGMASGSGALKEACMRASDYCTEHGYPIENARRAVFYKQSAHRHHAVQLG